MAGDDRFFRELRAAGLVCLLLAVLFVAPAANAAPPPVVIAHESFPDNSITPPMLRAIFSMRLQTFQGERLTVFVLDSRHPDHEAFSKEVLGVFPYQLQNAWNRVIYSGTGRGPVTVESRQEMLRRVGQTPGGVGYVTGPVDHPGVRVVSMEAR
ncbi:hypothetical protein [Ectothiorhodospira variabilis]|uniref:hypothetical protein n=1 Tax=Ectothiorhodospira variabilis TaxID=505694 RepID=UPI001EFBFFDD|nr:hypothetical protein [Ectothiorhodospira variabilis]MCG5496475.1 hypothetical protein [Ectothiorhodospira variabilis]